MKKLLILSIILVSFTQINAQDRIAIGLKAGINSTKLKLSEIPSTKQIKNEAKTGGLFGAYAKLRLIGALSVQPELYYAKKNTTLYDGDISSEGSFKTWDIPLLVNLQLVDLKVLKIYGIAGPVASFISKADFKELEFITEDSYENTNWTFQAGAGVEFWRLTADFRYEWGLKDISDIPDFDIGQKTDVFTFTVGFKILGI
ncbi:porin family protein [Saccharicrinis aurantiacus]|uniref:porin family protein n=1 Tax=Saccharicrinis aurantiacus TaxID=1849719 RepID=UPI00083926A8|nr:porin family protein [Saccharicrinis aurantiacus]